MKATGGMRGVRGLYSAVAAAIGAMAAPPAVASGVMDRPPGFMGVRGKVPRCLQSYSRNSKKPHQGAKECARRREQMGLGEFSPVALEGRALRANSGFSQA